MPGIAQAFRDGHIGTDGLREILPALWINTDENHSIPTQTWRELFEAIGYTRNGRPTPRPAQPLRLFRGAPESLRRRFSWTPDPQIARYFHPEIWAVTAPPSALLMHVPSLFEEFVVNTKGLRIQRVDTMEAIA